MKRVFLIFSVLFLFSSHSHALTLAQLKTEVRNNLRDSDSTRQRYSDATITLYLNEAQKECVNLTWLAQKTTEYQLTSFTSFYQLPSNFIAVSQAYLRNGQSNVIELTEYSQKGLYDSFPNWQYSKGGSIPNFYWVSNSTQATNSGGAYWPLQISYIPVPSNTTSTCTATIWYYSQVSDLSNDGDIPFDNMREMYPYHMILAYHATMRLKFLEGKPDEGKVYMDLYQNAVAIIKDRLGRSPNYTPGMRAGTP